MTPSRLFDIFRSDVQDKVEPFLWDDDEVYEYMDDAQKMLCRLVWGIQDSRSDITQIDAVAGDPWSDLSPLILKIKSAQRLSDFKPIGIFNPEDLPVASVSTDYGMTKFIKLDDTEGPLEGMITGMEKNAVRWLPVPVADDVVSLTVFRLPLNTLGPDSECFEVDEQHHRALLWWMKHLAYSKDDAETFDKTKAADMEDKFRRYCMQAKEERERLEHKPGRSIAYGGL